MQKIKNIYVFTPYEESKLYHKDIKYQWEKMFLNVIYMYEKYFAVHDVFV